jgi:hypothetical protein
MRLPQFLIRSLVVMTIAATTATAAETPVVAPAPLTIAGDVRVRNEYFNRAVTLADAVLHEQDVIRFRERVTLVARPAADFTLTTRWSAEPRVWAHPAFVGAYKAQTGAEWRFGVFDLLTAKWTKLFGAPLTLTVGRQEILLGEPADWWLVADGTPGDGSWSLFLDSARLTLDLPSARTKVDVIAIVQRARPDSWLPTLGRSASYPVSDQDEQGAILYLSNQALPDTQIDGYFIYKHDQRQTFLIAGVPKSPGDNADLGTLGGKFIRKLGSGWSTSLEAAYQFGTKQDRIAGVMERRTVRAYGAKARLTRSGDDAFKTQFNLNAELLSGDDPATPDKDEMFDVLWGRWPRWSELYIYSYINETGGRIAQLNNLGRLGATYVLTLPRKTTCSVGYNALFALEAAPTRNVAPALFSRTGHFRGHHVQLVYKRQFTPAVSGHVWFEAVRQGDFYAQREVMTFGRAELMCAF